MRGHCETGHWSCHNSRQLVDSVRNPGHRYRLQHLISLTPCFLVAIRQYLHFRCRTVQSVFQQLALYVDPYPTVTYHDIVDCAGQLAEIFIYPR